MTLPPLSVVGTNDLHGYILGPAAAGRIFGMRAARAAEGGGVVLLDAGDMFQGTLESDPVEGASVVRGYNALGYQAAAVGNHEFDFGPEGDGGGPARSRSPGRAPRPRPSGALSPAGGQRGRQGDGEITVWAELRPSAWSTWRAFGSGRRRDDD